MTEHLSPADLDHLEAVAAAEQRGAERGWDEGRAQMLADIDGPAGWSESPNPYRDEQTDRTTGDEQ